MSKLKEKKGYITFTFETDPDLRKKVKIFSVEKGISVKDLLNEVIECYLENYDKINEICKKKR
ncbi:MAG: hypothetical protein ACPLXO_03120 [Desulfurella sp.]